MGTLATVGVYGFTAPAFLSALRDADVRLLIDVRQRRGVRGSEYSWANAQRLTAALEEAGIEYRHHLELAPTTELRQLQYREDDRLGMGKRNREQLAPEYRERYEREILDRADLDAVMAEMPADGASALFCVERDPEACHRSIVAERMAAVYGLPVVHIRPWTGGRPPEGGRPRDRVSSSSGVLTQARSAGPRPRGPAPPPPARWALPSRPRPWRTPPGPRPRARWRASSSAAVSFTWGAGSSASGAPIQRTTSPSS